MNRRAIQRILTGPHPRLAWKFVYTFGYKGMRSITRFHQRMARGEYFPAFLFISVTNACNLSCQGCWISPSRPSKDMAPETLDRLILEGRKEGVSFFGILGGEPLLVDHLFATLARHPECYFMLFTNGTLLTDAVVTELRRLGNVSPLISIEGLEAVSDVRRGGDNVYARTLEGLARCREQRLVTGVAVSVCQSNMADLANETFVNRVAALGAHYLWYYIYRPVGPRPTPELALSNSQIIALRRFMVDVRLKAPLMVVDAYWDHAGRALCPAAEGIACHISPDGWVEPCPPLQCAGDSVGDGSQLRSVLRHSEFLARFRSWCRETTRGCVIMEQPTALAAFMEAESAVDSSGRETFREELRAMCPCGSHHQPDAEIPERSWAYRFAKRHWFFGLGAYG